MRIKVVSEVPPGYRELHEPVRTTDKAVLFRYHTWLLWVPATTLVMWRGTFFATQWAVDTARRHPSARQHYSPEHAFDAAQRTRGDLSRLHGATYFIAK